MAQEIAQFGFCDFKALQCLVIGIGLPKRPSRLTELMDQLIQTFSLFTVHEPAAAHPKPQRESAPGPTGKCLKSSRLGVVLHRLRGVRRPTELIAPSECRRQDNGISGAQLGGPDKLTVFSAAPTQHERLGID